MRRIRSSRSPRRLACSTPTAGRSAGPAQELHHLRQRQARPARHADRGRKEAGPLLQRRSASRGRPLLPLRPLLVRQGRRPGDQLRRRQRPGERRHRARRSARQGLCRPSTTTSRATNGRRAGTSPAWPRTSSCSTISAATSPIRACGRTGARTANSARPATSPAASATAAPLLRRRSPRKGERG